MKQLIQLVYLILAMAGAVGVARADLLDETLKLSAELESWESDFKQIRKLKTLNEPLIAKGHVWFQAPDTFLWRLGDPARTLALKATPDMYVIYPRLKRAEKYGLDKDGPWKDALALMEAGFPRSRERLESNFDWSIQEVQSGSQSDAGSEAPTADVVLSLIPKSATSRRWIESIEVEFSLKSSALIASELKFSDGSSMRNEFYDFIKNPDLESGWFRAERWVSSEYKVTEP